MRVGGKRSRRRGSATESDERLCPVAGYRVARDQGRDGGPRQAPDRGVGPAGPRRHRRGLAPSSRCRGGDARGSPAPLRPSGAVRLSAWGLVGGVHAPGDGPPPRGPDRRALLPASRGAAQPAALRAAVSGGHRRHHGGARGDRTPLRASPGLESPRRARDPAAARGRVPLSPRPVGASAPARLRPGHRGQRRDLPVAPALVRCVPGAHRGGLQRSGHPALSARPRAGHGEARARLPHRRGHLGGARGRQRRAGARRRSRGAGRKPDALARRPGPRPAARGVRTRHGAARLQRGAHGARDRRCVRARRQGPAGAVTAPEAPLVSIFIPAYNDAAPLAACLESLGGLDYARGQTEIVVWDNASLDDTGRRVVEAFDRMRRQGWLNLRLLRSPRNEGSYVPYNLAEAQLDPRGAYILGLDADVEVAPDVLTRLVAVADEGRVAVVGARSVYFDRPDRTAHGAGFVARWSARYGHADPDEPIDCDYVIGCCWLLDRRAFREIGGFYPRFFINHWGVDYCLRLQQRGSRIPDEPRAVARHKITPGGTR